jgi:hypothetical protein
MFKKMSQIISNNAATARSGFKAEHVAVTDERCIGAYTNYFQNHLQKTTVDMCVITKEKYDIRNKFSDGTENGTQLKKVEELGGQGHSFNRGHVSETFDNPHMRRYLVHLSIIRKGKRQTYMTPDQKKDFIALCNRNLEDIKQYLKKTIVGEEGKENQYWSIMKTDREFNNIELYMIETKKFYEYLENRIKIDISLKQNGTCLHLSPDIYLQRKGGEKTDKSPNDIQAKLKIDQNMLNLFQRIL